MNKLGYYCFPPVDPNTGEVSAADDAILMGRMNHCDVPEPHRRDGCHFPMDAHFWQDDGTPLGIVICPDGILARLATLEQAVTRVRELCADKCRAPLNIASVVSVSDVLAALDGTEQ